MYHDFFIHSSVDGHLGCFHDLAIVNTAAMNIRVHVNALFELWFSLGICPVVGLLDHMVNSIFSFLRNLHTVLHSGEHYVSIHIQFTSIYIPTNSARGFPFPHALSSICCL